MNKHKRYCFEAEEKKFKKIIAHNVLRLCDVAEKTHTKL
jgi:hypothetical protein